MALVAHLGLQTLVEHLVNGAVHRVAAGAGDIARRVNAPFPVHAVGVAPVTGKAGFAALGCGHELAARIPDPADSPAASRRDVLGAVAVAGRALTRIGRTSQVAFCPVDRMRILRHFFFVATLADLGARRRGQSPAGSARGQRKQTQGEQQFNYVISFHRNTPQLDLSFRMSETARCFAWTVCRIPFLGFLPISSLPYKPCAACAEHLFNRFPR